MKYRVLGIDRDTGNELELIVEAPDKPSADAIATNKGILVYQNTPYNEEKQVLPAAPHKTTVDVSPDTTSASAIIESSPAPLDNAHDNSAKPAEKATSDTAAGIGCAIMIGSVALAWALSSGAIVVVGLIIGFVVLMAGTDFDKVEREKREANARQAKLKADQDAQIVCPQCQAKGNVSTVRSKKRKGISGGRAVAAVVTGGLSLPFAGISRRDEVTEATCSNCGSKWEF